MLLFYTLLFLSIIISWTEPNSVYSGEVDKKGFYFQSACKLCSGFKLQQFVRSDTNEGNNKISERVSGRK